MSEPLHYARRDQLEVLIERELIEQEHRRSVGMWLRIMAGVPASFAAPFLLACVIFGAAMRFGTLLSFWPLFAVCAIVLVPLIYWRAALHHTDFIGEAAAGLDVSNPYTAGSRGELELRNGLLSWAGYQELFFWGPYLVLEAVETWRADQGVVLGNRERAVQIIRELLAQEDGVVPNTLRQREEPDVQFGRALRYLAKNDWIDFSRRLDRVWLLSEAREKLRKPQTC